jgi:mannose-6-phosphate isomerase-like protein (cupin superfamily)
MQAFELMEVISQQSRGGKPYYEFLRAPALSVGVYQLLVGDHDIQAPHTEDEVYYVFEGRGKIRVGSEDREVRAGSVVFVEQQVPHRFHSIEQDLIVLVFFAPAEYSLKGKQA